MLERITLNPEQCGGKPCIRGMRIRVKGVLELLASGHSQSQIDEELEIEMEDVQACLQSYYWTISILGFNPTF